MKYSSKLTAMTSTGLITKGPGRVTSVFIFLLAFTISSFAATEQWITSLSGKIQQPANVARPIAVGATLNLADQWYNYMVLNPSGSGPAAWDNIFTVDKAESIVLLRYDDSDRKKMITNTGNVSWKITIEYTVTCYDASGAATVYGTVMSPQILEITYDPAAGIYTDKAMHVYANSHNARLSVLDVVYEEFGSSAFSQNTIPSYLNDVWMDIEENVSRCYYMDQSTPNVFQHTPANNQMLLSWPYIQGAESYDVEFLFVDVPTGTISSSSAPFDFTNATRVNTPNKHFTVSLAYPRGKIIYRVRGVGRDPLSPSTRVEGPWSYDPAPGTLVSAVTANAGLNCFSYDYGGLELGLNWQYTATYVEDGKKTEEISFYDGSLHDRQGVTISNTDSNALVFEMKYDNQGRPAVEMLPAVESSAGLQYYQYYDGSDYYMINDYGTANFDDDGSTGNADDITTSSGANEYYSPANTTDGNNADYIPDADGFPFSQTRYMNDGTGRIRSQGSPGPDHQLGTGHETQYFYGTPGGQVELDRLFGNDVGYVSHYKKNMIQDPNGQVSIVYLDQEGRVVATCLAGEAPDNLIALAEAADPYTLTVDLLGTNYLNQQQDMVSVNALTVSTPGDYDFSYELLDTAHCDACIEDTEYSVSGCVDCVYDLEIMITNTDGDSIDINGGSPGYAYRLNGINDQTPALTFTVNLSQVGVYTVTKTLRLSQSAQNEYRAAYVEYQTCIEMPEIAGIPCGPGCDGEEPPTCPECEEAFTTGTDLDGPYYVTVLGDTLSDSERLDSIEICNEIICGHDFQNIIPDPCAVKYDLMLADVSLGGQYFENTPSLYIANMTDPSGPAIPNPSYQSYYVGASYTSGDENNWLNTNVLDDENPSNIGTFNSMFGSASIDNWKNVRDNWNPAWAAILIDYHPELCAYNYFCSGVSCTPLGEVPISNSRGDLWAYEEAMLMNHTVTLDVIGGTTHQLFNPLCMTGDAVHATGGPSFLANDRSTYGPGSAGCNRDPYFDCPHEICDSPTYDGAEVVSNLLMNYVPVYDAGGTQHGYYSIWYLLDDPDGIATCPSCTTYLSQSTIDIFVQVHDGIANGVFTKYDYFRGVYMYAKELAIAMGYDEHVADNSCPNTTGSPQTYEDGYLVTNAGIGNATPEGFVAHFPQNPMFAGLDGCETIDGSLDLADLLLASLGDYQDDNCHATCSAFSYDWMETLGDCIDPGDTAHVRALLIQICECSCGNDTPLGTDECAGGVVDGLNTYYSFTEVIEQYSRLCDIPVHPQPDPGSGTCSCQNLQDFIDGTGLDPMDVDYEDDVTEAFNDLFEPVGTYTWSDIDGWLVECNEAQPDIANLTTLPEPIKCAETEEPENTFFEQAAADCEEESNLIAANQASIIFDYLVSQAADNYVAAYRTTCLDLENRETFTVTFDTKEYYYTLFYYDQAGNLIKTIPPAGVDPITSSGLLGAVQDHRNDPDTYPMATYPTHSMSKNYKYNSLQQMIESTTEDEGTSTFWYDEHGRIMASQNARQALYSTPEPAYTYTLYDALGRLYETGETYSATPLDYTTARDPAARAAWLSAAFANGKKQVVYTYYDAPIPGSGTNDYVSGGQKNLRNQVSSMTYEETDDANDLTFDNGTHYSYDIHGNVITLVQENRDFHLADIGQSKKRVDYEYDIASGKVVAVHYQQATSQVNATMDEFHQRYEYDANNRIVAVYTSRDGYTWDRDANYLYYDHGALARTEFGDRHVQAVDYAYTIHGWVKGVNSDTRHEDRDIGKDGSTVNTSTNLNYNFGRDAFGYSLNYYSGDYLAINPAAMGDNFLASVTNDPTNIYNTEYYGLFNGNIGAMTTAITDENEAQLDVQGRNFRYDQLNRIRNVEAYIDAVSLVSGNYWSAANTANSGDYHEEFTYDLNGNILTADRNGHTGSGSQVMDDLDYNYVSGTNRLDYVTENASAADGIYGNDINSGQSSGNYTYDASGNLIADPSEQIATIEWTVMGKVKTVTRTGGSTKPDLEFVYDPVGNRIMKIVKPRTGGVASYQEDWVYTYYVRDAAGNVLTVYERSFTPDGSDYFDNFGVKEWHMYGSSRIGVKKPVGSESTITEGFAASYSALNFHSVTYGLPTPLFSCTDGCLITRTLGRKEFELSNHLRNVLETVTDIRLPEGTSSSHVVDYYTSDVVSYSDYFVFGALQSDRAGGGYRYSFNGQEKSNEISEGNLDFGARIYDSRLGRFLSTDPRAKDLARFSPYAYALDNPVLLIDIGGEWPGVSLFYIEFEAGLGLGYGFNYVIQTGIAYDEVGHTHFTMQSALYIWNQDLSEYSKNPEVVFGASISLTANYTQNWSHETFLGLTQNGKGGLGTGAPIPDIPFKFGYLVAVNVGFNSESFSLGAGVGIGAKITYLNSAIVESISLTDAESEDAPVNWDVISKKPIRDKTGKIIEYEGVVEGTTIKVYSGVYTDKKGVVQPTNVWMSREYEKQAKAEEAADQ